LLLSTARLVSSSVLAGGTLVGNLTLTGDLTVQGNTSAVVDITTTGDVTLGDTTADTITINGTATLGEVVSINRTSNDLLLQTTTSGNIVLSPAGSCFVQLGTVSSGVWQGTAVDGTYVDIEGTEIKSAGEAGNIKFLMEDGDGTCSWQKATAEGTAILSTGEAGNIKFLMEDGDGTCSWQKATAEGTAILSTGETGRIKFLMEDGDGTCSWQPVTGLVTSVSGSTGAVVDGDIDHDSLLNFASNEHFTQANITTTGTVSSGVWQGTAIDGTYVDIEGTEIKSTGETGRIKFLMEDGDGTCSWQPVTGLVTSVSGSTGAVVDGDIDHDQLLNFASNEHFTQAGITTTGTVSSGVWQGTAVDGAYVDIEGTEIKSAGETGRIKFLMEDGDGTCSWQPVTGLVTSVSGSTGAVTDGDIDHDQLLNFASNEHYTQGNITTTGTVSSGTWQGTSIAITYTDAKVTSVSGSTGAVVDGDIDHDSLLNFAANEHFTQANITTTGTIASGVWQGTAVDGTYVDIEGTEIKSAGEAGGVKYLREDGDGTCSWQTPSAHTPEGTAILSTGESSAIRYLREDGDGTCSWQVAPVTSVSGSTGAVTDGDIDHDSLLNFASNEHFTQANITATGTVASGTWQGTSIATTYTDAKVTSVSGSTGAVTDGDIDHDSLLNFAANEHFTQANITATGTVASGVWQGTAVDGAYVDIEGTEIKSTGEALGGLFLREDGDGTCSWQTPAGITNVVGLVEGTGVLSTGEAGGTKYLREDGDGSSSWQDVIQTPEGTAILSTGEAGGSKFLREDGDNSSSWQEVPGGPSLGTDSIIRTNAKTISENITFAGDENGSTVGPVSIANTYTVVVSNGSTWTII